MLAAANRLGDASAFREVTRHGRRAGARRLVVHVLSDRPPVPGAEVRIGLIVSRAVGNAVVRTQVKRRLRHLLRDRVAVLPQGSQVVVRALPSAAGAPSAELAGDLDRCLARIEP